MSGGSLYLGLDSSTQSLSAVVIEAQGDDRRVILETALVFDDSLRITPPTTVSCLGLIHTSRSRRHSCGPRRWT
ncbi:MAG: hypothetical protein ABW292_18145 [Vicinamibacterales bacterium]